MHTAAVLGLAAMFTVAVLDMAAQWLGPQSVAFAVVVVWLPMVVLGTVSHFVPIRLPRRWHALRQWELAGRAYELLGVRAAKALLRRGPFAAFNPRLHLPKERTADQVAALEGHMCEAEATHTLLLLLTIGPIAYSVFRGWAVAAAVSTACNIVMNGYPAMLQRYNRVLLRRRYGTAAPTDG